MREQENPRPKIRDSVPIHDTQPNPFKNVPIHIPGELIRPLKKKRDAISDTLLEENELTDIPDPS